MSGIKVGVFLAVARVLIEFRDDLGNLKSISGTGFWILDRNDRFFVTNRHNVDPTLKLGPDTPFRLRAIKLQMRTQVTPTSWGPGTTFVDVVNTDKALTLHTNADVAVLKNPLLALSGNFTQNSGFPLDQVADEAFLSELVDPMDVTSFIGFPGKDGKPWWDVRWQFPIARTVNVASWPRIPFTNTAIPTADTVLVSGLSFSGSSGSPVILHRKWNPEGSDTDQNRYMKPRLLGIMSGHWWDEEPAEGMFYHSGLSYFTRSTAILELIDV